MAIEKFLLTGVKADLPAVRDANKLYWCSDTRELYKGYDLYTEAVRVVSALPATMAQGVLYILPSGEVKMYDGSTTITVAKPYVTSADGLLTAANTDDQVATAKAVYDSITYAVGEVVKNGGIVNNVISTKAGTITVTKGDYNKLDSVIITGFSTKAENIIVGNRLCDNDLKRLENVLSKLSTKS